MERELLEHYVVEDRVNDEPRQDFRGLFAQELSPRAAGLDLAQAALEVNRWCAQHVTYRWNDSPTAGPLTVYHRGHGRCGEESVFTVAALRAASIPARQVYVPRWSHCDDNHAWVEVWTGEGWHFLGACEPELTLDRGWFTGAAQRAMVVRSRLLQRSEDPVHGPFLGEEKGLFYYNQTARYAPTQPWEFHTGRPGGRVTLYVLNTGAFHPIATLQADERGVARADLGVGDLLAVAEHGGSTLCKGKEKTVWTISPDERAFVWGKTYRFEAPDPPAAFPPPLTLEEQTARQTMLEGCAEARRRWLAGRPPETSPLDGGQGFLPPLGGLEVAAVRLPSGDQLFRVGPPGEPPAAPAPGLEELFFDRPMPVPVKGPCAAVWLSPRPGHEPSAHLVQELAGEDPFPVEVSVQPLETAETAARGLFLDPDALPLYALVDARGRCRYAGCGYQVGAAALMAQLVGRMDEKSNG